MRTRNARLREADQAVEVGSVEVEVANTIAISSAVGIDFSEVEEEVLEEIARREEEDLARYAAMSERAGIDGVLAVHKDCILYVENEALSDRNHEKASICRRIIVVAPFSKITHWIRNMDDMYRFVDTSALFEETGYKNDHRACELLSRMMVVEAYQLLLLPFNAG
ncbi:hypothetical protein QYF36_002753 [Acer negundo]|nr:hypothetical protein QYF36_002753 [Acer negundo]